LVVLAGLRPRSCLTLITILLYYNSFGQNEVNVEVLISQIFNGLSLGSILLLAALGLAFSFGLMKVINMAHREFIMVGAYVT
jgi:hypothetical protein